MLDFRSLFAVFFVSYLNALRTLLWWVKFLNIDFGTENPQTHTSENPDKMQQKAEFH